MVRAPSTAQRWDAALDDARHGLVRDGLAVSTVERVCKQVRRFAHDTATAPYDVTAAEVAAWLDGLEHAEITQAMQYSYRTSLRTFYRWALRHGRVGTDPTAYRQPRKDDKGRPAGWVDAIAQFSRWLSSGGRSVETGKAYRFVLDHLARETGAPDPWCLTAQDLADWMARHQWARETSRAARTAVRAFYRWAYDMGHVDDNPAKALPPIPPDAGAPRPASEPVYLGALANAGPRERLMLRLAGDLGLRRGEIAQVNRADVGCDAGGVYWLAVHGKGSKTRLIPLPDDLAAQLLRIDGWAFPGRDRGHLSAHHVGTLISRLLPAGVTAHMLRHRFATLAYTSSHDLFAVQHLLGHTSPATTQRYVLVSDQSLMDAVRAVNAMTDTERKAARPVARQRRTARVAA